MSGVSLDANIDYMGRQWDLFLAAYTGDVPALKVLLRDMRRYINHSVDSQGAHTLLMFALYGGANLETVELLLEHGANVLAKDNMGRNAIYFAANSGDPDILQAVLDATDRDLGTDVPYVNEITSVTKQNAFHALFSKGCGAGPNKKAAKADLKACFELLCSKTTDPVAAMKAPDARGLTPLQIAKYDAQTDPLIAKLLLTIKKMFGDVIDIDNIELPSNIDELCQADFYGRTRLLEAAFVNAKATKDHKSDKDIVREELANGADANAYNPQSGRSALRLACCGFGDAEMVQILLPYVDDPMATDGDPIARSALHFASYNGQADVVGELLGTSEKAAIVRQKINQVDLNQRNALHALATDSKRMKRPRSDDLSPREQTIELLFANGIDYKAKDVDGNTPLDLARLRAAKAERNLGNLNLLQNDLQNEITKLNEQGKILVENLEKLFVENHSNKSVLIAHTIAEQTANINALQLTTAMLQATNKRLEATYDKVQAFSMIATKIEDCIIKLEVQNTVETDFSGKPKEILSRFRAMMKQESESRLREERTTEAASEAHKTTGSAYKYLV